MRGGSVGVASIVDRMTEMVWACDEARENKSSKRKVNPKNRTVTRLRYPFTVHVEMF